MIWFWLRPLLAASVTAVNVVVSCLLHRWWSGHGRASKPPPFVGIIYAEGHGWPPPGSRGTPSSYQLYREWQESQATDAFVDCEADHASRPRPGGVSKAF